MKAQDKGLLRRDVLALGVTATAFAAVGAREARAQGAPRGGSLAVGFSVEPAGLDPAFGDAPSVDRSIYNMFYDNLFFLGQDGSLQPALATSWEVSADGLAVTLVGNAQGFVVTGGYVQCYCVVCTSHNSRGRGCTHGQST